MFSKLSRGLTLLELIIAVSIGALVLQLVVAISIVFNKTWSTQFNQNKINNDFMVISERLAKQLPGLANYSQVSKKDLPYADDLVIEPVPGSSKVFKVSAERMINQTKYTYFAYFKTGAY